MPDSEITVSGLSADWLAQVQHILMHQRCQDGTRHLDELTQPRMENDNQLYDHFKTWRKRAEMLMTGMALKKQPKEFICYYIKAWSGETGYAHIEAVGLLGDDANIKKCILNAIEGHCEPRSYEIVAATAYKQLLQGDLGLPEYIENCKEVTAACNFATAYDKCL